MPYPFVNKNNVLPPATSSSVGKQKSVVMKTSTPIENCDEARGIA